MTNAATTLKTEKPSPKTETTINAIAGAITIAVGFGSRDRGGWFGFLGIEVYGLVMV